MATFGQMLGRFQAQQKLAQRLSKAELGITGQEEKQDIATARREYQAEVEKAEQEMKDRSEKRGLRKLIGKGLSLGANFIPGVGPLASAAISFGLDYAAGESVSPYKRYIKGTLGDGLFFSGAREDYEADINATNAFIRSAAGSQRTANLVSALGSAIGTYTSYDAIKDLGGDVMDNIFDEFPALRDKTINQTKFPVLGDKALRLEDMDLYSGGLVDFDELTSKYTG